MYRTTFDIYNMDNGEFFRKTRTVFLYGQITMETAYEVGNCLKYLDYLDPTAPITLEVNSPGGDVSSGLAIIANHYGIPVYSLGPSTTIDFACPTGDDIPIEERNPDEIKELFYEKPMALPEVKCYNPAFDVTDHSLLSGIVTERGIVYPPFEENFAKMFPEEMANV